MERHAEKARDSGSVLILGGNASTLAFASSLRAEKGQIFVSLAPLAWTPVGVVIGEAWQRVSIAADNIAGWLDQTFPAEDERAFVSSLRDIELLRRTGWHAEMPPTLSEDAVVNPEEVPEDVLDALTLPTAPLLQCAVCRRTCVRDHFVWNDRQLCAWDYHMTVFGRRGPWHEQPYEERFFATLPRVAYVAAPLLEEGDVLPVLVAQELPEDTLRALVNLAIAQAPGSAYMAARTPDGMVLLREGGRQSAP